MACNFKDENRKSCNVRNRLHTVHFSDISNVEKPIVISLCQAHSDRIFGETNRVIDELTNKHKRLLNSRKKTGFTQREYPDTEHNRELSDKIKRINQEIKRIRFGVCRFQFCKNSNIDRNAYHYPVTVYDSFGKWRFTFNFCSRIHQDNMKAKCGITLPVHNKQYQLDSPQFSSEILTQ